MAGPSLGRRSRSSASQAHEADDCSPHSEGVHAEVQAARLATAVHGQAEMALPACSLEHLQMWATVNLRFLYLNYI